MISLPQHDPSPTRAAELLERRARYEWDHDYLPPFPFLSIPNVGGTGVLDIYEILAGSYAGLPPEERPSDAWIIRKVLGGGPAFYELLERVPRAQWVALLRTCRQISDDKLADWVRHGLRELLPVEDQRQLLRLVLPRGEQIGAALTEFLLRALNEVSAEVIERDVGERLRGSLEELGARLETDVDTGRVELPSPATLATVFGGFMRDTFEAVGQSARTRAGELVGARPASTSASTRTPEPALEPEPGRASDPWLPAEVKRIVAPAELLVRFAAKLRRYRAAAYDGKRKTLRELITDLEIPDLGDPTCDDAEFGRRQVAGTNPVMIRRVEDPDRDLPTSFAVRDAHLEVALEALGLLDARTTLAEAARAGRLYVADYALLADIPCQRGPERDFFGQQLPENTARQRYLPAPYGLFYRWGEGESSGLWPVAIQLGRDPEAFEVFTPAVEPELWQRVKLLYMSADFNHHELATHLAGVHFTLEAFAVACARQLHARHPVSALLGVHFQYLLWNNFLGRQILTNPEGFVEQMLAGTLDEGSGEIMRRHYAQWSFSDWVFPRALAERGVDDRKLLPIYPFRDDGLRLWDALHEFVSAYVAHYYASPDALADDHELQAWAAELCAAKGGHVDGFPLRFESRAQLCEALTAIIFQSSTIHSAVNYGQFDLQSDAGRVPGAIYADPREIRRRTLGDYMPGSETTVTQAGVMYVLAEMRGPCLDQYSLSWFEDPEVWPLVARYRQRLARIEAEIQRDNATVRRDSPYAYLRPSKVTTTANV